MKLNLRTEILSWLIILAAFGLGFYFFNLFPEQVVSHWNFAGEPDDYSGKFSGAFAIPFVILGMYLLFLVFPKLDPKKERYADFQKTYLFFRNSLMLVMLGVFIAAGFFNLGYPIKINIVIPLLIGLLMIVIGNIIGKLKKNWFMGIRNPWTLSSENVWNKTHRVGGYTFILFGIIIIVSPFLPKTWGISLFILGIMAVVFGTMIYSYLIYRKEKDNQIKQN